MSDKPTGDNKRGIADKIGGLSAWIFGGFLILGGIAGFGTGSVIAGIIGLGLGIVTLPITRRKIGINPPGIDGTNRARRNVLIGGGYGLASLIGLAVAFPTATTDGDESQTQDTSSDSGGSAGTEISAENEQNVETETTEQSNNQELVHEIGESFTVGEGDRVIEYTVNRMVPVAELAPDNQFSNEEPDGVFLVVELGIENKTDESFDISTDNFAVVTENDNTFEPSDDATVAFETDERFDTESILFEQINPNLPIEGAVIFDIPTEVPFSLRIEPEGFLSGAESHLVPYQASN